MLDAGGRRREEERMRGGGMRGGEVMRGEGTSLRPRSLPSGELGLESSGWRVGFIEGEVMWDRVELQFGSFKSDKIKCRKHYNTNLKGSVLHYQNIRNCRIYFPM